MRRWTLSLFCFGVLAVVAIVRRPSSPEVATPTQVLPQAPLNADVSPSASLLPADRPPASESAPAPVRPTDRFADELNRLAAGPMSNGTVRTIKQMVADWARVDPAAAAAWTATIPKSWTWTNPDGSTTNEATQATIRMVLVEIWAAADPVSAASWVAHLPSGEASAFNPSIASILGTTWAQQNPQAAAAWARTVSADSVRSAALHGIYEVWVQRNAAEAAAWIAGRPRDETLGSELAILSEEWTRRSPRDAARWVLSLRPEDREPLVGPLASLWTILNVRDAARWLATTRDGEIPDWIFRDAGERLGLKDAEAAVAWASALPEGRRRTSALLGTSVYWGPRDVEAAAAFFDRLPNDMGRNGRMARVAVELLTQDPSAASFRRLGLSNGPFDYDAQSLLPEIFKSWSAVDPVAASAWASEAVKSRGGSELKQLLKSRK